MPSKKPVMSSKYVQRLRRYTKYSIENYETDFFWVKEYGKEFTLLNKKEKLCYTNLHIFFPAFNVTDFFNILPHEICADAKDGSGEKWFYILMLLPADNKKDGFQCIYCSDSPYNDDKILVRFINKKPSNSMAEIMLWCLRNNYIDPEKIGI